MSDGEAYVAIAVCTFFLVFFVMIVIGPTKGYYCTNKKQHDFGQWEKWNNHLQARTCKTCGWVERTEILG